MDQLVKESGLNQRALRILLDALVSLNYLKKEKDAYANTEDSQQFLSRHSQEYISGFGHTSQMWKSWSWLTEVVKLGPQVKNSDLKSKDTKWLESFIEAMDNRATKQSGLTVEAIRKEDVSHILDIGGGSAAFSIEFLKKYPKASAVVFDLPNVLPITEKYIQAAGMGNRISCLKGDYLADDFGRGYDIIFLSAIIHINSFDQNKELIKRCSESLNQGGIVVIQDHVLEEDRTSPASATLFAVNMLVGTDHGDCYTQSQMEEWFGAGNLVFEERNDMSFGVSQIIGKKK
ncbi:MAG: hypothetical protein C0594_11505 [Marinilabiliales bacterium]|nr:MAG: hypothetical protein C0594_11505 [Marinilabiliales bacterium]